MKIAVLISGGVDSSVALRLLKEQGHDLVAFYLKIWLEDELAHLGDCPWREDLDYVQAVCDQAEVPLRIVNLQREYWDHVVADTIAQIKKGRTPNPDIWCNQRIKFGFFDKYLQGLDEDFDKIATGHYAQVEEIDGRFYLKASPDPVKDQTYFLSYLNQSQLSRCLFPLGSFAKNEVRTLASKFDLPNKDRKDSQGICFLGKFKFSEFLHHHLGEQPGDMIEVETGKVMGQHRGFWYYTIGQRQGLRLSGGPWYVVSKDTAKNIVYISRSYYDEDKSRDIFGVKECNWFAGGLPAQKELQVKLRHGAHRYACTVEAVDEDRLSVKLAERDQGIAQGQFAVFYDRDVCLGSGVITNFAK